MEAQLQQIGIGGTLVLFVTLPSDLSVPLDTEFTAQISFYIVKATYQFTQSQLEQGYMYEPMSCAAKVTSLGGPRFKLEANLPTVNVPGIYGVARLTLQGTSPDQSLGATSIQGASEICDLRFEFVGSPSTPAAPLQIISVSTQPS